jgi:hypothetical protein
VVLRIEWADVVNLEGERLFRGKWIFDSLMSPRGMMVHLLLHAWVIARRGTGSVSALASPIAGVV